MPLEYFDKKKIKIGIKQSTKAIEKNQVKRLYIARDAEKFVIENLIELAKKNAVEIIFIDSMRELGKYSGIEVKATSVVEIL